MQAIRAGYLFVGLMVMVSGQSFEGRPSRVLSNGELELTVLLTGTSLVNLTLAADPDKLSPLWNPVRMARELGRQGPREGGGFGHFVCVDGFGPVSREERDAGLSGHGEAHRQMFEVVESGKQDHTTTLTLRARLPITQENFTRTFRMVDGENVIYVDSVLESLLGFDRPINWAEHATIGSPFLEAGVTAVDVSGTRSRTRPYDSPRDQRLASNVDFTWPDAPGIDGKRIDVRVAPANPNSVDHTVTLLDAARPLAWVTAIHPGKRLVFGYLWKREQYPWIQFWGDFNANGKLARGLEFGSQPFDVSRRETVTTGTMFDIPTFHWLPAKSKLATQFLLFYAQVPDGFTRVDDVRLEGGRIVIEDRTARKQVTLMASRGL